MNVMLIKHWLMLEGDRLVPPLTQEEINRVAPRLEHFDSGAENSTDMLKTIFRGSIVDFDERCKRWEEKK